MSTSNQSHKSMAAEKGPIQVAIVTVSDTRTTETDVNAHYLRAEIEAAGHHLVAYHLIKDEPDQVIDVLETLAASRAEIVLFNGGTGISKRDTTFDALSRKLEKTLPGFGEIFRVLSYDQIGASAMLSRATAGVYRNTLVFSTPGSPKAVQLAWEKLLRDEISHLAWEITR